MRLFDIAAQIEALLNASVDPETGEIREEALAELDALGVAREQRVLDVAAYAVGQESEADAIEATAKKLRARADVHRNHATRLRQYIEANMTPGEKLADNRVALSWRRSEAVEIVDDREIPDDLCRIVLVREADKVTIKKHLKSGELVRGARLVSRQNLVIR